MPEIVVPEHFARLGFTGLFNLDIPLSAPDDASAVATLRARVPYLSRGWLVLRINNNGTATVVRRDSDALIEAFVR